MSIDDERTNKGTFYKELNKTIKDIPKIVINHGTPWWPECHTNEEIIEKMKVLIGDNPMVVNSYKAAEEWGWGHTIWHGMGEENAYDRPKEARVVTSVSPAGLDTYYNRKLCKATSDELNKRGIQLIHFRVNIVFNNWEEYKEYLGSSLVYFDFSLHTPMNRAKTEAMMSGCALVTAHNNDVERYIENGVNGFIIPNNPVSAANIIEELLTDYNRAIKIGKAGQATAKKLFGRPQYRQSWLKFIKSVIK